jgi:hypothetical protein
MTLRLWLVLTLVFSAIPAHAQQEPAPPAEQPVDLTQQGAQAPQGGTQAPAPAPQPAPQAAPPQGAPPPGYGAQPPGYAAPPPGYGPPPGYPAQYEPPPPPPPIEPEPRTVSLTLSPLHLIFPVLEVMAEFRPVNGLGLAAIAGYGQVTFENFEEVDPGTGQIVERDLTVDVLELGLQAVWYPLDPFDGLQVGAEFLWVNAEASEVSESATRGVAVGIAVGPFVGYKLITSGGFTLFVQGGGQYVIATSEPENPAGVTTQEEETAFVFLLNFGLGWSF